MKSIAPGGRGRARRPGRLKNLAVGLAIGGLAAGCSVAGLSPSPTAGTPPSSLPSVTTPLPATPNPTPTTIRSVGTAPAGAWSGISWISAGAAFPQTPAPTTTSGYAQVYVFGWSRGYVGFRTATDPSSTTDVPTAALVSTSSADGLHWTAGRSMDVEGLMKDAVYVTQVVEGPSGLLAIGHYPPATCGGPPTVVALWTSTDGLTGLSPADGGVRLGQRLHGRRGFDRVCRLRRTQGRRYAGGVGVDRRRVLAPGPASEGDVRPGRRGWGHRLRGRLRRVGRRARR